MIVDLCAGLGGWDLAFDDPTEVVGVEIDRDACTTRNAIGLTTVRADITAAPFGPVTIDGICASPPCQTFSSAGKGDGRRALGDLCRAVMHGADVAVADGKTELVLEPLRWTLEHRPRWLVAEQVPPVLPVWEAIAWRLGQEGYSTWAGVCNAADFGVPQTRKRAILIASLDREVGPPTATHARDPQPTMFGTLLPWVSMAEALGWTGQVGFPRIDDQGDSHDGYRERDWRDTDEPAFAVTEKARSWVVRTGANSMKFNRNSDDIVPYERTVDEPAPTLDVKAGHAWVVNTGRDWKKGGTRDDAQQIPISEPSPTVGVTNGPKDWHLTRPATTVACDPRLSPPGWRGRPEDYDEDGEYTGVRSMDDAIRLTVADALILQDFPADLPVHGTKTARFRQIGNAIPVGLARAIVQVVM